MRKCKRQGRLAHSGRSSREGSLWDSEIEPVYSGPHGDFTAREHHRRFKSNFNRGDAIGTKFTRRICSECGGVVQYDARNFAFCVDCGAVHNDGMGPPAKVYDRRQRVFFKTAKA